MKPGHDEIAARNVAAQDFRVYQPACNINGKKRLLLPRYIFIEFDIMRSRWSTINNTRGIVHLLPLHSETPVRVERDWVAQMRKRIRENLDLSTAEYRDHVEPLSETDKVHITSGAFSGFHGIVKSVKNGEIMVSVLLFGTPCDVRIVRHQAVKLLS